MNLPKNLVTTPYPKEPKELDVYVDEYWTNIFGPLQFVAKISNELRSYPLSWLENDDFDFSRIKKKISGTGVARYIFPIGKLEIVTVENEDKIIKLKML